MSNKQLPVWRMNTGNGVPSDCGRSFLYRNHSGIEQWWVNATLPVVWDLKGDRNDIHFYQTTRTKAAKYRGK